MVSYVGIDIDPELKYPKGAARVTFASTKSFVAAIVGRFVTLSTTESQKRVGFTGIRSRGQVSKVSLGPIGTFSQLVALCPIFL